MIAVKPVISSQVNHMPIETIILGEMIVFKLRMFVHLAIFYCFYKSSIKQNFDLNLAIMQYTIQRTLAMMVFYL